jgi:yecA family protein
MIPDEYENLYARLNKSGHAHMPPDMLDGYLCAVIISPDAISPHKWIPTVFFEEQIPEFSSLEELQSVTDALLNAYNTMVTLVAERNFGLVIADGPAKTFRESLLRWCEGFLDGYDLDPINWDNGFSVQQLTAFGYILQLTVYSLQQRAGQKTAIPSFVRTKKQIVDVAHEINDFVENTYALRLEQYQEKSGQATRPGSATYSKPRWGRNQPCPCGSGQKFKKCCGKIE